MNQKKFFKVILVVGAIITILLGTIMFLFLNNHAVNAGSSTKPDWEEGDYWRYQYKEYEESEMIHESIHKEEVIARENITVNGKTYESIKVKSFDIDSGNETNIFFVYYRVSDLAMIKAVKPPDSPPIPPDVIYNPPLARFDWPIDTGKFWERNVTLISIMNISGIPRKSEFPMIFYYECLRKEKVETEIGSFQCFVIKEYSNVSENNYLIHYFSKFVGNDVKTVNYNRGNISSSQELISFYYQGRTHGEEENDIPAFEFLSLIMVMLAIVLLSKGGRNAKWKKNY